MAGQLLLLFLAAVVLKRQDHGVLTGDEGRLGYGLYDVLEGYIRTQSHTVRDNGLRVVLAVPAVELNTSTAGQQDTSVHLHARLAVELTARQICIMRRVDKVVTQRLVHVLVDFEAVGEHGRIVVRHEIVVEALDGELLLLAERPVRLVEADEAEYAVAVVVWKDDLVEARIALKLIGKVD